MRVLILNYEFLPLGGGAGSATYYLSRELVRMGNDIVVLTSGFADAPAVQHSNGVEIHRVPSLRRGVHDSGIVGAASYLAFARRRMRRLLSERKFDLAHIYFALPTGLLAGYWQARTGKPYIVSLRGSDVPNYDRHSAGLRALHALLLGTNRRIVGNASAVVANSESLRRLALASFPQQRIDVVTNGVCPRSFRPPRSRPARNTVRALCVARLIDRKGLESMLRGLALTRHESLELDFVGLGPRLDYLKGLADTLGVANRVRFRGHLAGAELADAYRDADIFLLTSLSESFSMALLEGMASGLPVVATRIGGIPELVTEGENGLLVPPNDPRSLAEKLDILAASPERRARIGANNRRKIEASYGWSAIAKQYMDRFYSPSCQGA